MDKAVIEIKKSDVSTFLKVCDGLCKQAFTEHAKCCLIRSISPNEVELCYYNNPNVVRVVCENKTAMMLQGFVVKLNVLRELCTVTSEEFMSFIRKGGRPYLSLSGRDLYIETEDLDTECYTTEFTECNETLDMDKYSVIRSASPLTFKMQTSYQNLIIKDGGAYFNTGAFIFKAESPFSGSENLLIPRPLVTTLNTLFDVTSRQNEVKYGLSERAMTIKCNNITLVCQICIGDKVNDYVTDTVSFLVGFEANLAIEDRLTNLLSAIGTLSYMDDVAEVAYKDSTLKVSISNIRHTSCETYPFPVSGANNACSVKIPTSTLLSLLRIEGTCTLAVTDHGVGVNGQNFKALLRRVLG